MSMDTLELVPLRWLGWDFRVRSRGEELTTVRLTRLRDRGEFALDGQPHRIERTGSFPPTYRLERGGTTVARAEARGFFRRSFTVTAGERILTLRPTGLLGHGYRVEHGRAGLGEIRRLGVFTRRTAASFDGRIDPAVRILLLVLVQLHWRRRARRSG
jgi:hypothetical protein